MQEIKDTVPVPSNWSNFAAAMVREISPVNDLPFEKHVAIPVGGQGLKHNGIYDGDVLIVRPSNRYVDGSLAIWETPKGQTARYAEVVDDDLVILHDGKRKRNEFSTDDIRLVGIVVRVERDLLPVR
jgi:SOS-response transcriptional repressor LexA